MDLRRSTAMPDIGMLGKFLDGITAGPGTAAPAGQLS